MVHLDYRDSRPIYAQIVDGYREQIQAGILQPGEKLPSVRELAVQLSINPNTIQRSYRQLEAEGWIATVPGKGCYVAPKNLELIREENLKRIEEHIQKIRFLAATCGMDDQELLEMIRINLEEPL